MSTDSEKLQGRTQVGNALVGNHGETPFAFLGDARASAALPPGKPFSAILDSISSHVAILDLGGRIRFVNAAWREFGAARGGRRDGYLGNSYLAVCEQAAQAGDRDAEAVRRRLLGLIKNEWQTFTHLYQCVDRSFQLQGTRIEHGGAPFVLLTHDDVTAVSHARAELSNVSRRLLEVQEAEQRRIAIELHDSTSQHLVALQLGLSAIRQGRATEETLSDMQSELAEAHKEIRSLSYLLHPPALGRNKLTKSVQSYLDGFHLRTGTPVSLTTAGAIDMLPASIQRSLFRVVQEAVSNAHRHARAKIIRVSIRRSSAGVRLLVRDRGNGAPRDLALRPGVGIAGMEARIHQHQGVFSMEVKPSGVHVRAFVPAKGIEVAASSPGP